MVNTEELVTTLKVVKRNGNLITYYLRPYLGLLPIGRKIRYKELETLTDGSVRYTRYSADGRQIVEEGKYLDGTKLIKIGLWTSRNIDKNENSNTVSKQSTFSIKEQGKSFYD